MQPSREYRLKTTSTLNEAKGEGWIKSDVCKIFATLAVKFFALIVKIRGSITFFGYFVQNSCLGTSPERKTDPTALVRSVNEERVANKRLLSLRIRGRPADILLDIMRKGFNRAKAVPVAPPPDEAVDIAEGSARQ